jgi:endonuclease/exonuclease/phosphatase family metal-dependent hydrolase
MRVVTFNILNGRSLSDNEVSVEAFARAVRSLDADVLALQEVDRNQTRSHGADLTAVAAEAMGAVDHRFVAALSGSPGATWVAATGAEQPDSAAYGIALLSRHPVVSWQIVRLARLPAPLPMRFHGDRVPTMVRDEPRVAVAAGIRTPAGTLTVANTHLSFIRWWNRRQLRELVRSLDGCGRPLLLTGDLNMGPRPAAAVTRMRSLAAHATFPADHPCEQIDHVLADGPVAVESSEARRLPLSDHQALVVDVSLPPSG